MTSEKQSIKGCKDETCPISKLCYRAIVETDDHFEISPGGGGLFWSCNMFWPMEIKVPDPFEVPYEFKITKLDDENK